MLAAHQWVAVAAVVVAFAAAVWGFVAWRRRTEPGAVLQQLLVLVQTLLVAQVAIGLLLVGDERRTGRLRSAPCSRPGSTLPRNRGGG